MGRTVKDYMDFVKNVKNNIPNQSERIVYENQKIILDLNRIDQLYEKGENSEGKLLKEYKPFTVDYKIQMGQPYDRTTLFEKGNFYKSFVLKYEKLKANLSIKVTDEKAPNLLKKYGKPVIGWNKINQEKINYEIIKPNLWKYIKQWL